MTSRIAIQGQEWRKDEDPGEGDVVHIPMNFRFDTSDPLHQLCCYLAKGEMPPVAWVVEWSRDGTEPVDAAWRASSLASAAEWLQKFAAGEDPGHLPFGDWSGPNGKTIARNKSEHAPITLAEIATRLKKNQDHDT